MRRKLARRREWTALVLLIALALGVYYARFYAPWWRLPDAEADAGTDWFLAVRVPEYPADEVGQAGMERRLDEWLSSLREHGFTPVYLTDALGRLARGESLPRRPVVLLFTHSYRKSVERLGAILLEHEAPALWVADQDLLDQSDQRLVSPHARGQMRATRRWDLGHFRTSTRTWTLEDLDARVTEERQLRLSWAGHAGSVALNRRDDLPRLSYLSLSVAWTGRQVVERLFAEVPLRGRTALAAANIFNQTYGLPAYDLTAERLSRFNLVAPAHARSAWVQWLGAAGLRDVALDLDVGLLVGELWVSMRSDGEAGHSVRVGFTADQVVVDRSLWGRESRLAAIPVPPRLRRPLAARVELRGRRLRLELDEGPARPGVLVREVDVGDVPALPRAALELLVYNKVRGVAQARSVALTATPLFPDLLPARQLTGAPGR